MVAFRARDLRKGWSFLIVSPEEKHAEEETKKKQKKIRYIGIRVSCLLERGAVLFSFFVLMHDSESD